MRHWLCCEGGTKFGNILITGVINAVRKSEHLRGTHRGQHMLSQGSDGQAILALRSSRGQEADIAFHKVEQLVLCTASGHRDSILYF
ncbi:hypothetical protein V6N12_018599 [Hibiscus sabdariffa]|uniref:Uncharacterized protein n=1 Tax=Hibiscus sabdariffa TaxID=183260 RepID=A0ABR2AA38_9ROSI